MRMPAPVRKAVFPAAGLGTRFLPATKAQPKEMLPLVDKPTIQYGVEEAVAAGVTNIILVTGRGKNAIEDHFDRAVELVAQDAKSGMDFALAQAAETQAQYAHAAGQEARKLNRLVALFFPLATLASVFGMNPPPQSISPDSIAWSAVVLPVKVRNLMVFTLGRPGW